MPNPHGLDQLVSSSPDVMGGSTVFRGTRVPLEAVFDNLASGLSLDEVLDEFPTLDRDDVTAVLRLMPDAIRSKAS